MKLRIAMLISTPIPPEEGIANYALGLSRRLVAEGHEVVVVTRGGLRSQILYHDNLKVFTLPFLPAYPFHVDIHRIFANKFFKEIDGCLDVIHAHTPLPPAIETETKIVTTFHTPLLPDSRAMKVIDWFSLLKKAIAIRAYPIEKSLIRSSQIVSAVSYSIALDLEKYYGLDPRNVMVFGNAVRDMFISGARNDEIQKDERRILYVGRLDYRKGVLDLVESMRDVVKNAPQVRLVIVGKGPLLPHIIKKVADLGLSKHVEIKGFVTNQDLLLENLRASIFVQPSYYEGLPTTVLEAMASGTAVVATSAPGNVDIVKHGQTGLLVPLRSPKSISHAVLSLLEDSDWRERLGRNGRRYVKENFTWDKVVNKALDAYYSALKA
jgi:glycosyltransferase involved in cell wall biosynthesis